MAAQWEVPNASDIIANQTLVREVVLPAAQEAATHSQNISNAKLDKKRNIVPEYNVGDTVMIKDMQRTSSHEPRFVGPYKVIRKNRRGTYQLQDALTDEKLHRSIPISQMKRCGTGPMTDASGKALEADLGAEERFYVENVIKHRKRADGAVEYYVQWRGYDESHNSWETAEEFDDAATLALYWRLKRKRKRAKKR